MAKKKVPKVKMSKVVNVEKQNVESENAESNDAENNNRAYLVISFIYENLSTDNYRSILFKN